MKVSTQYRTFDLDSRQLDKSKRSIFLSFSSETPVKRMYSGEELNEVLDHNPKSVDLERLKAEGAVLRNHDPDQLVGKVEQVEIAGRKGRAKVRFGKTDLANETWSLIEDGILTGVSVGYEVHEAVREDDTLRVTRWVPTEISMVTNAADLSVGIGRSKNTENELLIRDKIMTTETKNPEIQEQERQRVQQLIKLGKKADMRDLADEFISNGSTPDEFRKVVFDKVTSLNQMETNSRTITDATGISVGDTNHKRDLINKDLDVFVRTAGKTRAMSISGGPTAGENAVIPYVESSMANLLREASPIRALVDVFPLNGYDTFEEVVSSGIPGSVWIDEEGARSETSNPVLNKVTTELKEIYSLQTLTQRLLDQSFVDLGRWIMERMAVSIAELESDGFVNGTGGNSPKGLLAYNLVTAGDDTRAFGSIQYVASGNATLLDDADKLIELFYELKAGHRSRSTWLMNSNTARTVMQLKDGNGNYLWNHGDIASDRPATLMGRPVVILEDLPDVGADTFPIWVGDWKTAIRFINGEAATVTPDPYTNRPNVDFYSYFYVGFSVRDSEAIKALKIAL